jgi:hypothetical protein
MTSTETNNAAFVLLHTFYGRLRQLRWPLFALCLGFRRRLPHGWSRVGGRGAQKTEGKEDRNIHNHQCSPGPSGNDVYCPVAVRPNRRRRYRLGSRVPTWSVSFAARRACLVTDLPEVEVVWPEAKQIGLIDSIFRNFYIPPVIFGEHQTVQPLP